jgi:hypothetical protein
LIVVGVRNTQLLPACFVTLTFLAHRPALDEGSAYLHSDSAEMNRKLLQLWGRFTDQMLLTPAAILGIQKTTHGVNGLLVRK